MIYLIGFVLDAFNVFKVFNFLTFLKNKLGFFEQMELDLADSNGEIKNLQENRNSYLSSILKEREKYILLKIESKLLFF
jgi:hypothetical protein